MTTPAQRFASSGRDRAFPALAEFRLLYDFELDPFQVEACRDLENGHGVLVAAPTGSGKTIVGEFAVHLALARGSKCFYTTPIKALSNQKFSDLVRRYGHEKVGLLTGDNSINGSAPVVVMTTEVLRNMLYAGSTTLDALGFVVMDEVHYLADRFRGAVWEEVMIHLPESVSVASLSATVSNAEEFGEWLSTVRGDTRTIVEERRPVPLYQHVMVGRRLYDLFADDGASDEARVNPELGRVARDDWRAYRTGDRRGGRYGAPSRGRSRNFTPGRVEVIDRLDAAALLPAIFFIFSRAGCDAAVQQCLNTHLRLTSAEERQQILALADRRTAGLTDSDLEALGYPEWAEALSRGVAAHHAGMLPVFKECVEELFTQGLVRVVFATETLALGINMPARSVVLDRLTKWNGETHAEVTPGEYTQLTGRAGRRGIDLEGHGVVLWQPGFDPRAVAGLASTRTYPLRSSFKPSYNMAVNLVRQVGRSTSRELLESSFAQFQADRAVVGLAQQLRRGEEALDGYRSAATCDRGDFMEYAALRHQLTEREQLLSKRRRTDRRDAVISSLERLKVGDVVEVPSGRWAGLAVVVDPGLSSTHDGPRPHVVTADRHSRRLSLVDFSAPVTALTRLRISKSFNHRNPQQRRDLAAALRDKTRNLQPPDTRSAGADRSPASDDRVLHRLRTDLRAHPCHVCPDREDHARWSERYLKLERETQTLRRRIEQRTNTIARQFDRVCEVLTGLDYMRGDAITDAGQTLTRIYSEMDLVTAECLRRGLFSGLDAAALAAVLSALCFESRNPDDSGPPRLPGGKVRSTLAELVSVWAELDALESEHSLDFLREPDLGFAWAAYRWAGGAELDDVLNESELAAGDFVRWTRQLVDLTDQVSHAAGDAGLAKVARQTVESLRRGVVDYTASVDD
jgi:ATP-dependent RNA helicase HelY